MKTSLREVWRGGVSLLEDGAEAILAGEVGGVKKEEEEEREDGEERMREDGKEDEDGAEELAGGGRGGVISDAGPEDYRSALYAARHRAQIKLPSQAKRLGWTNVVCRRRTV